MVIGVDVWIQYFYKSAPNTPEHVLIAKKQVEIFHEVIRLSII